MVNDDESSDEFEEDSGDGVDGSGGEDGSADEEDDDEEPFDSVCSICDEGGPLLWYVYLFHFIGATSVNLFCLNK